MLTGDIRGMKNSSTTLYMNARVLQYTYDMGWLLVTIYLYIDVNDYIWMSFLLYIHIVICNFIIEII